ncbi:uncharacterized protein PRD47_007651 [Ara ararauna]
MVVLRAAVPAVTQEQALRGLRAPRSCPSATARALLPPGLLQAAAPGAPPPAPSPPCGLPVPGGRLLPADGSALVTRDGPCAAGDVWKSCGRREARGRVPGGVRRFLPQPFGKERLGAQLEPRSGQRGGSAWVSADSVFAACSQRSTRRFPRELQLYQTFPTPTCSVIRSRPVTLSRCSHGQVPQRRVHHPAHRTEQQHQAERDGGDQPRGSRRARATVRISALLFQPHDRRYPEFCYRDLVESCRQEGKVGPWGDKKKDLADPFNIKGKERQEVENLLCGIKCQEGGEEETSC